MNIFRLYNQNKVTFWIIVIVIVLFLMIIQLLNNLVVQENKKEKDNTITNEKLYENKMTIEEPITQKQVQEDSRLIIDQFIKYCNSNNIDQAYNLLTTQCKQNVFPTIEVFENNYVRINFKTQRFYEKELYKGSTYKITFYENMISTGNINEEFNQDYYTIEKENGETKLNISNYIRRQEINKRTKNNFFEVEVIQKDTYMEYEIYELKITNLSQNTIKLDTKQKTKTMYLLDENDAIYYATSHEVLDNNLLIKPLSTNTIFIKYTKEYKNKSSKKLVFEDIILNYDAQKNESEQEKAKVEINV